MVSFETAKRLKEAGFPQPKEREVCTGNFWYDVDGDLICYGHTVDEWGEMAYYNHEHFAPVATDILIELGDYHLEYFEGKFTCIHKSKLVDTEFEHENAAEACALAWLNKYG